MREILFRGKRIYNGEWVDGNLFVPDKVTRKDVPTEILVGTNIVRISYEVDPSTVGQYTGLTDKNGKRIFEGDIVEYNDGLEYFTGEVDFENGAFCIGSDKVIGSVYSCCDNAVLLWRLHWEQDLTDEPCLDFCAIIGNIHDNPELLEEG